MGTKYSQFPASSEINTSDVLVGLHNDGNSRFSFSTILVWIRQSVASFFVPTSRTVNNKALSADITLTASDVGAQPTITANGILKGDGQGGVSAAVAGTDYQAPLTIDATPTANSTNPVQSGGVYTDVRTRVPVYGLGKNLLDNWYFLNAVNQRNIFTVVATNSNVYTLDRWNAYRVILAYGAGGPLVFYASNSGAPTGYVHQWIEKDVVGKQVTASVLLQNGTLLTMSGLLSEDTTLTSNNVGNAEIWVRKLSGSNAEFFIWSRALNAQVKVVAAKLELGTEQTLCHNEGTAENPVWVLNEIPDYEYELYRCITSTADPSDTYANKSLATRQDLTSIQATGTTNTTGAVIPAGAYFYLNGILYRAKTQIDQNATFTVNTNCEQATVGEDLLKLDNLIAKTPGSGTRDAQLQVGTYNSVATMNFVSLPSRSPGKPDVYVDFAETYIRVYYVKSDGTTTTKTYLPS